MPETSETVRAPMLAGGAPTATRSGARMLRTATAQSVRTEMTGVASRAAIAMRRITRISSREGRAPSAPLPVSMSFPSSLYAGTL